MKKNVFLLILFALLAFGQTAWAQWSGSGTQNEPYQIASTDDWNTLATNVNAGTTYSGKYFKLMGNISVTNMVGDNGSNDRCFSGIFDGGGYTLRFDKTINVEYCAPFRRINNATVKNLKIAGEVTMNSTSSARFVGGVVAYTKGTSYITNCINSTTITSNVNGDAGNGGIAGMVGAGGKIYITGCVFNGKMIGSNAYNWAGVIALVNSNCTAYISDCLFVPSEISVKATGDNYTVCRATGTANISNCYYTETMSKVQNNSTQVYSITSNTGVTVEMNGTANPTYDVSGLSFYSPGLTFNDIVYAANGETVSLNLSVPEGYVISGNYSASAGTLTGTSSPYTLTMPNENVIITANVTLVTVYRKIEGYGDSNDRWAFIASPMAESIAPSNVNNLIGNAIPETDPVVYDFDLYRFNPLAEKEWENYHRHNTTEAPFMLVNGQGYLYATKETKTLAFTGTFNTDTEKTLENLPVGFNLVGNPFTVDAYVNKSYYTLNSDGSAIVAKDSNEDQKIPPCYGVIVEVNENETVRFNTTGEFSAGPNNGGLQIAVSQVPELVEGPARDKGGVSTGSTTATLDNAIVSFNEDSQLGKFYFGRQNANIYLPQDGKDYAIAYSDRAGEMPVNFKAKENGQYTITVKPEGVEMSYLHLIDNKTGADIDLLALRPFDKLRAQGPASYTFTAKTTDYASRFKLVFVTNNEDGPSTGSGTEGSGTFAFISNGNIILTAGADDAILQIVDVMGRVLVSRDALNASPISTTGMTPGVYVLRLINGDNVKTQKIIIE